MPGWELLLLLIVEAMLTYWNSGEDVYVSLFMQNDQIG
jgi:hypothetical protein